MTAVSRRPTYARHYAEPPQQTEADGSPTWITGSATMIIAITAARSGAVLSRADNPDEYMLILPPGTSARVTAGLETRDIGGDTLTIIPPGASEVVLTSPGTVARIFSNRADDLAASAANAAVYADGAPEVRKLMPWPDPVGGFKIRSYTLAEYETPGGGMIQPRIFRSTNLMINVFTPWNAVRDTTKMSPHWHDDFEQASITLEGNFIHHIRTPWGIDLAGWHPDETVEIASPSVTIIPATLVHSTRNQSADTCRLIDVFAPPRFDFSLRGMVRNAADYPMPEGAEAMDDSPKGVQTWAARA